MMPFWSTMHSVWERMRGEFSYSAAEPGRRRMVTPTTKSEDRILDTAQRKIVIEDARDLRRNYSVAAWMIRRHLDYVATFAFQCKTKDKGLNSAVEQFIAEAGVKERWDVCGRHSIASMNRLAEAHAVVDGDVGWHLLRNGMVQGIEGERIRTPASGCPEGISRNDLVHGVRIDRAGRAIEYCVNGRSELGGWQFERMVPARHLLLHGYFDRYDQVRGISPLTSALNSFRDTYEGFNYALAKAKVAQLFGLAFYRDGGQELEELDLDGDADDEESATATDSTDEPRYKVDISQGSPVLDLDPGDKVDILESRTPSAEFQQFMTMVIMAALKSLDIPYCFYDESHTNYSGSRQAWLQYEHSVREKRARLRELLGQAILWRLAVAVLNREMILPRGVTVRDLILRYIPIGVPWIDPLKETKGDAAAVESTLNSRQRICLRHGDDWFEIADELEEEELILRAKKITYGTTVAASLPEPKDDDDDEKDDRKSAR